MFRLNNAVTARAMALAAVINLTLVTGAFAQSEPQRTILPAGTVVPVRLDTALSSRDSRPGDKFSATVRYGSDDAGLPEGTRVEGVVREALPSGDGKPGTLDVDFTRMRFPNGDSRQLEGQLIDLKGKSVKRGSDGRLVATADRSKDRLKFIGIGAGAGLIIGALTKNSSLISVLLGAGAGAAYNELAHKKPGDVNLKAGTEFGVRLDRQFAFMSNERRYIPNPNERLPEDRKDDRYYRRSGDRSSDIGVLVDDRDIRFTDARPFQLNGTYMLPLEQVARAANVDYTFDSSAKLITCRSGDIRLAIGSRVARSRGNRTRLDAAAEMRGGTVYVPMQFVAMMVNGSAYWDGPSRTVIITSNDHEHR